MLGGDALPSPRQPGAEPVLVPVGAVRRDRRNANPASLALTARLAPMASLVQNPWLFFPSENVWPGCRDRVHRIVDPLVSPQRGDGDHPVIGLAASAQPLPPHVRGLAAVLAVPAVVDDRSAQRGVIGMSDGAGCPEAGRGRPASADPPEMIFEIRRAEGKAGQDLAEERAAAIREVLRWIAGGRGARARAVPDPRAQ
jgi:hypothetical protein